jgi:hypothetical protein
MLGAALAVLAGRRCVNRLIVLRFYLFALDRAELHAQNAVARLLLTSYPSSHVHNARTSARVRNRFRGLETPAATGNGGDRITGEKPAGAGVLVMFRRQAIGEGRAHIGANRHGMGLGPSIVYL